MNWNEFGMKLLLNSLWAIGCVVCPAVALAQTAAPAPPPPTWVGSAGVGMSLTGGNSDTLNYNLTFDVTRTPKARNVIELKAQYLRGEQNGAVAVDRTSIGVRDQYTLSGRLYLFGQVEYLRDTFKRIEYLVAPAVGVGRKVIATEATQFSVDAGIGSMSEKNPGRAARTNAALTASETLTHQLTPTASITHGASALWKANDFSDGLYTVSLGLATTVAERLQLSLNLLDTFKTKPPTAATKRNDVSFVAAITVKF